MAISIAIPIPIPAASAASPRRTAATVPGWWRTSAGWRRRATGTSPNAGDGLVATRRWRRRPRRAYRSTAIGTVTAGHPGGLVRYTSSSSAHRSLFALLGMFAPLRRIRRIHHWAHIPALCEMDVMKKLKINLMTEALHLKR